MGLVAASDSLPFWAEDFTLLHEFMLPTNRRQRTRKMEYVFSLNNYLGVITQAEVCSPALYFSGNTKHTVLNDGR